MSSRFTIAAGITLAAGAASAVALGAPAPTPAAEDDIDVPAAPAPSARTEPPSEGSSTTSELAELKARLEVLEKRAAAEPPRAQVRDEQRSLPTTSFDASPYSRAWGHGLLISGYIQGQYQESQASEDQLDPNGADLNQNRFLVRRARMRFDRGWDFAFATLEIDGNNENGLAFGLRRAEASLLWRGPDESLPPLATLTLGLTDVPFGYELFEPNRTRIFLERTTASRAFFPGDPDFGARVAGAVGLFRYAVGVYDGTPVPDSDPSAIGFDPTSEKDVVARFGVETQPTPALGVSGGASFLRGTGFHPGTPATKNALQWQDTNQSGAVDPGEVTGVPAQSAQPSKTFDRWLLGVDLQGRFRTPLGRGIVYGEVYVGDNYDRSLVVADPTQTGVDVREIGWYAALVQEITPYGLLGLRLGAYDPNADATIQRGALLVPRDQTITTWSPLVGLVLPGRARIVFEYDHILNLAGLDSRGVPTSIREDAWALRLQVEL